MSAFRIQGKAPPNFTNKRSDVYRYTHFTAIWPTAICSGIPSLISDAWRLGGNVARNTRNDRVFTQVIKWQSSGGAPALSILPSFLLGLLYFRKSLCVVSHFRSGLVFLGAPPQGLWRLCPHIIYNMTWSNTLPGCRHVSIMGYHSLWALECSLSCCHLDIMASIKKRYTQYHARNFLRPIAL